MKTRARQRSGPIKNALHLLLIAVAGLMPADRARAQTFTTLHDFTALSDAPTLTEPVRRPAWCWRGRHPVWGDALWRQFRRRHGVQSGHLAATGHHPFRNQRGVDVAGQCRRVHPGITDESRWRCPQPRSAAFMPLRFTRACNPWTPLTTPEAALLQNTRRHRAIQPPPSTRSSW